LPGLNGFAGLDGPMAQSCIRRSTHGRDSLIRYIKLILFSYDITMLYATFHI